MITIVVRYSRFSISTLWEQGSFAKVFLLATLAFFHFPFAFSPFQALTLLQKSNSSLRLAQLARIQALHRH